MKATTAESGLYERLSYQSTGLFSELFSTYCSSYEALASYFAGDFRSATDRAAVATAAASVRRQRTRLVELLLDQNEAWEPDHAVRENIHRLVDPDSIAVVTGQQVGLFGGPLYTLFKTITAVQLAEKLHRETGRPVVPVFWLEGEDHDFEEVAQTYLPSPASDLLQLRYSGHELNGGSNRGPIGRLVFDSNITNVVAELESALAPTEFRDSVMEAVSDAYRPGTSFVDAFARLTRRLLPGTGLVFISSDDRRIKELAKNLFRRAVEDERTINEALDEPSKHLGIDFHEQITTRGSHFFLLTDEGRIALDPERGGHLLRGTSTRYSGRELLAILDDRPDSFSPNVVMRPVFQDWLLPTAAYVAGPGEVAYFAQLGKVYEWAGIPMPIIYPRASATAVEPAVLRTLSRYDLTILDLSGDLERLFADVIKRGADYDLDESFGRVRDSIKQAVGPLESIVATVDPTLSGSLEAAVRLMQKEVDRFKGRVLKAEKRSNEVTRTRLEKAANLAFPQGKPQERVLSPLYFVNKGGLGTAAGWLETLSLDTSQHQVFAV